MTDSRKRSMSANSTQVEMFEVVLLLFKDPPNASELVKQVSVSDMEDGTGKMVLSGRLPDLVLPEDMQSRLRTASWPYNEQYDDMTDKHRLLSDQATLAKRLVVEDL
ncbi:hypothetical protein K457DRAFT_125420 [Linnemannia elongata AG-77]|uniref:Uncharacterized protein n=1 Tax=Linnemannia elongata AG-77 TaxID=1314771 RepID=A0A197JY66_9FUNG|nr:hypothetical protein K457DRAFT_125420 [Linnemannia elongata AG-77]